MGLYRGGRKPGAKGRKTDLHAICEKHDVNVFEEMLLIAKNTDEKKDSLRFNRFAKLAEWLYSKPREIDITPEQVREHLEAVANDSTRSA